MNLNILDEGIIWKHRDDGAAPLIAFKGHSIVLRNGEILHAMQVGTGRFTPDAHCRLTRSTNQGRTWSEPVSISLCVGLPTAHIPRPQVSSLLGRPSVSPQVRGLPRKRLGVQEQRPDAQRSLPPTPTAMSFRLEDDALSAVITCDRNVATTDPRWRKENGGWVGTTQFWCRSTDDGRTWPNPKPMRTGSATGGFNVVSSPVYTLPSGERMVVIEPMVSGDLAELDHEAAVVFNRNGDDDWGGKVKMAYDPAQRTLYFDPRMAQLKDGRFVALYWAHDPKTDTSLCTRIGWSADGRAWTFPLELPFWGFLSYPLPLQDGRLLAVFNHRREPQGIRCVVSEDDGVTWDLEGETILWDQRVRRITGELATDSMARKWEGNVLAEMGTGFQFGIPFPIQLPDGSVFVSFYATLADGVMHQRYVRFRV